MAIAIGEAVYVVAKNDSGLVAENHPASPENGVDRDYAKRRERYDDGELVVFPPDGREGIHILNSSVSGGENVRTVLKLFKRGDIRRSAKFVYVTKGGHLYRRKREGRLP